MKINFNLNFHETSYIHLLDDNITVPPEVDETVTGSIEDSEEVGEDSEIVNPERIVTWHHLINLVNLKYVGNKLWRVTDDED